MTMPVYVLCVCVIRVIIYGEKLIIALLEM